MLYRKKKEGIEFFLVHPGGPFWKNKDAGAWSIPKGEFTDEEPLTAACREFEEETGCTISGKFQALEPIVQKGGKMVFAFTVEGDIDASAIKSNLFSQEWPYKSGKWQSFPEVDKAGWFDIERARILINSGQIELIDQLLNFLKVQA